MDIHLDLKNPDDKHLIANLVIALLARFKLALKSEIFSQLNLVNNPLDSHNFHIE